jgi:hypothetical protein
MCIASFTVHGITSACSDSHCAFVPPEEIETLPCRRTSILMKRTWRQHTGVIAQACLPQAGELNLAEEDAVPEVEFNEIIWKAIRGANSEMPAPVRSAFVRVVK